VSLCEQGAQAPVHGYSEIRNGRALFPPRAEYYPKVVVSHATGRRREAQVAGPPAVGGFEGDVGAKSVVHVGTWKPRIASNTARNTEHATWSSYMVKCLALFVFAES